MAKITNQDPQLGSTIQPEARGLHSIWNAIFTQIAFTIWILQEGNTSTREDFKRRTRGRLGTTREGFKTTREAAGVPSSFMAVRVLLKTWLEDLEDARGLQAEAIKTTRTWLIQLQSTRGACRTGIPGPTTTRGHGPCVDGLSGTTLQMGRSTL